MFRIEKQIRLGLAAIFHLLSLLDLGYGVCKTAFLGVSSGGMCWNLRLVLLFLLLLLVTTATLSLFTCCHCHLHMDQRYIISTVVKELASWRASLNLNFLFRTEVTECCQFLNYPFYGKEISLSLSGFFLSLFYSSIHSRCILLLL